MTTQTPRPEIMGTRTGYVIRFTCPVCAVENIIVNKTPRDHYKETRDASCRSCRKRSTVMTPNGPQKPKFPPVAQQIIEPVIK